MRILGIDAGEKRIGIAISDGEGRVALPLTVIQATGDSHADAEKILEIARLHGAEAIVVGLARSLSGALGEAAKRCAQLAEALRQLSGLPVALWDERLTTAQAERAMAQAGLRERQRRGRVDKVAAAIMLQSYLDAHAHENSPQN